MADRLIDSTVWIDYTLGQSKAAEFLAKARREGRVTCSIINSMEVLVGVSDARQRRKIEKIFEAYEVLPLVEEDSWHAARIIRQYAPRLGVGVLDALIAVTALWKGLILATHNGRHFRGITGLKVERPY